MRGLHEAMERWGAPEIISPQHTDLVRAITISARKLLGGIAAITTFILAVEFTLRWNNIRGVYTCGNFSQLFPLVVGATNFSRLLY